MEHCIRKIGEIVARAEPDSRSLLQLGYNLGRLSELTGLGREPFWDRWKDHVATWDRAKLQILAQELPLVCGVSLTSATNVRSQLDAPQADQRE